MNRKKLLIAAGIGLFVVLIIVVNVIKNTQESGIPVQAFKVQKENLEQLVLASGKVEVGDKLDYTAQLSAAVTRINVEVGDPVTAGDVLIQLDTAQLERQLKQEQANLAVQEANLSKAKSGARTQVIEQDRANLRRAEAAYNNAKNSYERSSQLFKEGAISKESLEAARLSYVSAEAEYHSAQQRLDLDLAGETREGIAALEAQIRQASLAVELTQEQIDKATVKAGIDGIVLAINVEEGRYVSIGSPLITIGDPKRLVVKSEVSESDSGNLKVGQQVTVTAAAVDDEIYKGKVTRVSPVATTKLKDQAEQTNVEITVEITDFDKQLKPGYSVDLNIATASLRDVPVVPYEAVIEKGKKKSVFVIKDRQVALKEVVIGVGNELYLHVLKGLKPGDEVVVNPPEKLKDKDIVDPQKKPRDDSEEKSND